MAAMEIDYQQLSADRGSAFIMTDMPIDEWSQPWMGMQIDS